MAVMNEFMVDVLHVLQRNLEDRNLGGTQTSTTSPTTTAALSQTSASSTPLPTPTMTGSGGGGPTSSPLLFFVALGFGVVFTNLWIIVGVKYCFRYNARNRALRNGEEVDGVNLENMPPRPHRRRREKKLMTMDEVNDRFPLTKYKTWVASRAREGLPTNGGVTAPSSRAASLREVDGAVPSSPVDTKHSVMTRPATANTENETTAQPTTGERKSMEAPTTEKQAATAAKEESNPLEQVRTTASTVDKTQTGVSELDDDDDDDHIHTAVPPELLTNPGDSCAICIDTLEDNDDIRGLSCGHAFHAGCLDPWLTSRRACCPLCKADYYTPKPRPEGEAAETERTGRRRDHQRANMPQAPPTVWNGLRGHPRLNLQGRFGNSAPAENAQDQSRSARRAGRRQAASPGTEAVPAEVEGSIPASRGWRPSNPFSSFSMPAMRVPGRNRQQAPTAEQDNTAEATPSQLEAGVMR
ncbi:hypothetical protein BJ875DRAFT_187087 [Amylocarpus encephaloides]|uniref:RING-type domain-containing protein n=1 Tax=Amylocarpus encephaloides TaxID=45428 RepID=A0A9P8C154_9HELO|nr:hypothetical protein BJ875DRAFT_187087 [Amylocarpus encephaloides]